MKRGSRCVALIKPVRRKFKWWHDSRIKAVITLEYTARLFQMDVEEQTQWKAKETKLIESLLANIGGVTKIAVKMHLSHKRK